MESYEVEWQRSARRETKKLDNVISRRIIDAVMKLKTDPLQYFLPNVASLSPQSAIAAKCTATTNVEVRRMSAKKPEPTGYLVDSHGNKTCVILTIQDYEDLLEELEDLADIAEGRDEELIPHEEVTRILKDDGLL